MNTVALGTGEPSSPTTRPVKSGRAPGAAKVVQAKRTRPTRRETSIQMSPEDRRHAGPLECAGPPSAVANEDCSSGPVTLALLGAVLPPAGAGETPALPCMRVRPTPVFTFMTTPRVANPLLLFQRPLHCQTQS